MTLTVAGALARATAHLADAGVPTPEVDAELLVRHALGWSRTDLLLRAREGLPAGAGRALTDLVTRRGRREPLQLILGAVGFRGLELEVRPGVFIPRPETETLAGEAIDRTSRNAVVVEPCTGAGAIACAVAAEAAPAQVVATDSNRLAVELAARNARRLGLAVDVLHGDLLAPVDLALLGQVDVLVSNPPYLASDEIARLEPEVTRWDPAAALVAGPTGHEIVDRLLAAAGLWLRPGAWVLVEVDSARATATAGRLRSGGFTDVAVTTDLAGRDRVVSGRMPR